MHSFHRRIVLVAALVTSAGFMACVDDVPATDNGDAASGDDGAAPGVDGGGNDGMSAMDAPGEAAPPLGSPGAPSGLTASAVAVTAPVTTLAGSVGGHVNGNGVGSSFLNPRGVGADTAGNIYVADALNDLIRKITPARDVTTFAGIYSITAFAEGAAGTATFNQPGGVAVDGAGNLYVADSVNNRIRKVTPAGVTSTLAGTGLATPFTEGAGASATFSGPTGVAVDAAGNVFVADLGNNRIRKVTAAGVVSTLAGSGSTTFADGTGTAAGFSAPSSVAVDVDGNVFVADEGHYRIRKVTSAGVVTTIAGSASSSPFADGTGAAATFAFPRGVAVDKSGNVYVADANNHRIRRVTSGGVVTTLAGTGAPPPTPYVDGAGSVATFNSPIGVAVDANGWIFVGDQNNNVVRKIAAVGIGQLSVIWAAPSDMGTSAITGYTATASAAGHPTQSCTSTGSTTCTISPLFSGVVYTVTVTATNASGTGAPSSAASGLPN